MCYAGSHSLATHNVKRLAYNRDPLSVPWLSDLEVMHTDHSPSSPKWVNSIAVCAVMKNENVTDVTEWLRYYQCVFLSAPISGFVFKFKQTMFGILWCLSI